MQTRKRVIVIVDGYSTSRHLVPYFKALMPELKFVHVQSEQEVPDVFKHQHEDEMAKQKYIDNIIFTNPADVKKQLEKYDVLHVIVGSEPGVEVADILSEAMGMESSNGAVLSPARREKDKMHEALGKKGIARASHLKTANLDAVLAWARSNESGFVPNCVPVVIKPVNSAATDNVFFCYTEDEIKKAFTKVIAAKNIFDHQNQEVLAQQFLNGDEYIINTVSRNVYGHDVFFVADVMKQHKNITKDGSPIYDYEEPLSHDDPIFKALERYVELAAGALNIKNGPAHFEVKMTTNRGPVLIECAARLGGGMDPKACHRVFGHDPVSLTALAYLFPGDFAKFVAMPRKAFNEYMLTAFLISDGAGKVQQAFYSHSQLKARLPAFYDFSGHLDVGDEVMKTKDLMSSPGAMTFIGTQEEVRSGYQQLKKLFSNWLKRALKQPTLTQAMLFSDALNSVDVDVASMANSSFGKSQYRSPSLG